MILRVLGAVRPRGATWSGQVISSPSGPSGGPFMTHLLPGGGVPRAHGAWSPVPPRLPHLATPRSACRLATVVAGAYPLRRPPNAWSPGVPAPLGPCYWLVASGTPVGWHGGCLAMGPVRGTVCHYCLGGCSALVVCARHSRQVWGVGAGAGSCVYPVPPTRSPPPPRCVWRAAPSGCPLSSPAGTPSHAVCAFHGLGRFALHVRSACPLRGCALALPRRLRPFPLPGSVWRVHPAWFRCRAPVGPFHAVRAPPRFLPQSRAPSSYLGGGRGGGLVPFPPYLVLCYVPPRGRACASGAVRRWGGGGGGRSVCRPPSMVWLGGPGGRGAGGCSASVRPSAFLARAPKRASSESLSSWRVWSP